ncbi:YraN family protein [Lutibacter sp.]|uniref:YraN family protein n=1 Tax=Lutibacter sp. TaxID=1925666 RepID=UPI001A1E64E5|nr:YraN family protein [Lutibacter sp.]MBI9040741.1 YraN family protein [Lutibacter sp.]
MATHNDLGNKGEEIAVDFLQKNNYKIVEKNWRFKKAEVDIIALKKGVLAVVEVKTRSSDYFGDPQDFVNQKKIKLLVEAINEYVISKNLDVEVRFDIIAILKNQEKFDIKHLKDAFFYF